MISLRITQTKDFMQKLLSSETFDVFLLEAADINTYNSFSIDGHMQKDFFAGDDMAVSSLKYDFSLWKELRPLCFQLIKGKHTPLSFKFVLHLIPEYVENILSTGQTALLPEQIRAFVLTIRYDGSVVTLITGTCYEIFSMDKEPERLWDRFVRTFLEKKEIAYEEGG